MSLMNGLGKLQRREDGVIHLCSGAGRRRDILSMDFADFRAGGIELNYSFDIDIRILCKLRNTL